MTYQEPIPKCCKEDCKFRDPEAKFMPACTFRGKLIITKNDVCESYKAKEEIKEGYFGEELDDDVYASREVREAADKSAKEKNPT